jgi:hypothetical protein
VFSARPGCLFCRCSGSAESCTCLYDSCQTRCVFCCCSQSTFSFELVCIPKTVGQAQKQQCAPCWNAVKELGLARHRELHTHDDADRTYTSFQVLDTKWAFDLKIDTTNHMSERFKTCTVVEGQPQIMGFDYYGICPYNS